VSPSSPPSSSPSPSSAESPTDDAAPSLNPTETRIADSLAALGIASDRAEYSVFGGTMWSQFGHGLELFVSAIPVETDHAEFAVLSQRDIEGIVVLRVAYGSGAVRDRFVCDTLRFEVEGDVPPGFVDIEAFLAAFIGALDCHT
jgi:hypothetical protein